MIFALFPIIVYSASLMLIFPLVVGTINISEVRLTSLKIIYNYCIVLIFFELLAWFFVYYGWQNHFINNTMCYTNVVFFGCYYLYTLKNETYKKLIKSLIIVSILIIMWSNWGRDFNKIDALAQSVTNICLISMSLIFFYQLLNNLEVSNLFTYSHFWINISVLINFSCVFFTLIYSEYITFSKDPEVVNYWYITEYSSFLQRILLGIGLWYSKELVQSKNLPK